MKYAIKARQPGGGGVRNAATTLWGAFYGLLGAIFKRLR